MLGNRNFVCVRDVSDTKMGSAYLNSHSFDIRVCETSREGRSRSAQGLTTNVPCSPAMKIPLPPRLWITDVEDESSDGSNASENGVTVERARVRSRYRHHKQRSNIPVPIGIFWDIENCQVPRGCSAIDVVAAIRAKFLPGRREADFVIVCDVRKEVPTRLQELNDAQVSLIHVCGTQKNAADEKLRQCMRRFGELHSAPASLLLISGDINFAADLSDFRYRKNMEVILVHKQNSSSALITCASSHYCFNELLAHLPRNRKTVSQTEEDDVPSCEMEVANLPVDQPPERVSRRLRRLADNCGGKVLRVTATTATLRFATPDHASRALKRMDGEDVFGRKISTRYVHSAQPAYSSDEGYYSTAFNAPLPRPCFESTPQSQVVKPVPSQDASEINGVNSMNYMNAVYGENVLKGLNGVNGVNEGNNGVNAVNGFNSVNDINGLKIFNGGNSVGVNAVNGGNSAHGAYAVNGGNSASGAYAVYEGNGANGAYAAHGVNGENGFNGVNGVNGLKSVDRGSSANGAYAVNGGNSANGFYAANGVNGVNSLYGGNSANGTYAVNGGNSANGTYAVNGGNSANETFAVNGGNSANGGYTINGVNGLNNGVKEYCASRDDVSSDWALALRHLPSATPPLDGIPSLLTLPAPPAPGASRPRQIRGTHGGALHDRSSSSNSSDERRESAGTTSNAGASTSAGAGSAGAGSAGAGSAGAGSAGAGSAGSRAVSPWNCSGSVSEHSEAEEQPAEVTVSNLPPYDPNRLQEMLTQLFSQYVAVVRVAVWMGGEGPLAGVVLRSEWDARLAIARIHKRRLDSKWSGRRLELSMGRPSPAPNLDVLRARLRTILRDQPNRSLPLLRLRDAYASRHCCALTTSDLAKVRDTVVLYEGLGRVVQLVDLRPVTVADIDEAPWKCPLHAAPGACDDANRTLQPVFMTVQTLARHVHVLLESHGGILPLLSFLECYSARFPRLETDATRGVALELLLRCVPGVQLRELPSRHLCQALPTSRAATPVDHLSETSSSSVDRERPRTAPVLEPMLALFEKELVDLLRSANRCTIPFSKLIPAFHHHFGRQCRVADYGFTKLPDLLAALSTTIVVLGSGSGRVITLSSAAQSRRWSSDLVKLLRSQPGRAAAVRDLPALYQACFGRPLLAADYGVCTLHELMERTAPNAVQMAADGTMSLPRRTPTPEERSRTHQFAIQAVELLCYTPNFRMEFSRFVPAFHAHFERQLRVAHYGCVKLVDLFESIPDAVCVDLEPNGERSVRLAHRPATALMAQRLVALCPIPLASLGAAYAAAWGAPPLPQVLGARDLHELVFAAGGCVDAGGMVLAPGAAPRWASAQLAAAAVLVADRSVARGSTQEYFVSAFRRLTGTEPELANLLASGVVEAFERRICLAAEWRAVWRVASLLAERGPLPALELLAEYTRCYEPNFAEVMGPEGMSDFLRAHRSLFFEVANGWALAVGVVVPRAADIIPVEDYSVLDTPPGQKGSRVFDSPKTSVWCSPPASALPVPTALLGLDFKRRTRLAAAFDIV